MTLVEINKFKVPKPKFIEGKDLEAKNSGVAIKATKRKLDQHIEEPHISVNLSKDCTNFSLKDWSKSLCPMHQYSTNFIKGTSCLVSNIGDAELKIDASYQRSLK